MPRPIEEIFREITQGLSHTGQEFFEALVCKLSRVLEMRLAFIAVPSAREDMYGEDACLDAIAVCEHGVLVEPLTYELHGTPCEQVFDRGACFFPRDVAGIFPEDGLLTKMGAQSYLGVPLRNAREEVLGVLVVVHDEPIDNGAWVEEILELFAIRAGAELERTHLEGDLERQRLILEMVFDNTDTIIVALDGDGRVISLNETARHLLAIDAEKVYGEVCWEVLNAAETEEGVTTGEYFRRILSQEEVGSHESICMRGQQKRAYVAWRNRVLYNDDGAIAYLVATGVDVTTRRHAEVALKRSEQQLRMALEAARMGIWEWDLKRGIIEMSPQASSLFGVEAKEIDITAQAYLRRIAAEDREDVAATFRRCLEGDLDSFELIHRLARPVDGAEWVEIRGRVISTERGAPAKMMGTIADITELRSMEAKLMHGQRMEAMGRLAGGVAHDFNNLLTVIMSYGDLLHMEVADEQGEDAPVMDSIVPIQEAAERGAELTQQLLAFARRQIVNPRVVDVNESIDRVLRLLQRLLSDDIELRWDFHDDLPNVHIDPSMLEQVLMNLAVNAKDAMPVGGRLYIKTSPVEPPTNVPEEPPWVEICVEDTGEGMSEEVQQRAFDPFFTTKGSGQGTGMGLATSHSIIEQFGGRIAIESEVGEGTVLRIHLPGYDAAPEEEATGDKPLHSTLRGAETILLVEDDVFVRRVASDSLRGYGYTVLEASDGVEALEIARDEEEAPIDLLLTDLLMPRMSGDELADVLAKEWPDAKILFTSGFVEDARMRKILAEETYPIVLKPYTPATLASRVRSVLDNGEE